jgi:hypothetical protein
MSRGGKRPGAGRPPVVPADARARLVVTVSADQLEALDVWAAVEGYKDRSAAVRAWMDSLRAATWTP